MIGFHGIGILFHGICISFRCISLHFMNFVTFRFMSSKRNFATDGAPYEMSSFFNIRHVLGEYIKRWIVWKERWRGKQNKTFPSIRFMQYFSNKMFFIRAFWRNICLMFSFFFTMKPIVDILERCNNRIGLFTLEVRDKFILKLFFEFSAIFLHPTPIKGSWLVNYFGQ